MRIANDSKNIKLQITLKSSDNGNSILLTGKELKIILYKPNGTREEITDNVTTETIDGTEYITWQDENYTFDIRGFWGYAGFADIESPDKSGFWVV